MQNSSEIVDRLWDGFFGNMNDHPFHVGACEKFHCPLGDDNGCLWHFTRLSVLKKMLELRQIWLSDLTFCNDKDEVKYGLRRITKQVDRINESWDPVAVKKLQRLAKRAKSRFTKERHVYAFSLSEQGDTRQHWDAYGGGLHISPDINDPYIAIGFDAEEFAWPIQLTDIRPPIFLFNVSTNDQHADRLAEYWFSKALRTLIWLEQESSIARRPHPSTKLIHDALERMLVCTCALMKDPGWQSELEYRLLFINENFGEIDDSALPRTDRLGQHYIPVEWEPDRAPIRAVMVHPLGRAEIVRRQLSTHQAGRNIEVCSSQLKPIQKG